MNARPLEPAVTMVRVVIVVLALLDADKGWQVLANSCWMRGERKQ